MQAIPHALAPLVAYKQFIVYIVVPSQKRPGKTDKYPVDYRTGRVANAHDPAIWLDAQTALQLAPQYHGVGFVFTKDDPFWFLDADGCFQNGEWSPIAQQLCQVFAGAAVEVSQSCTGLHLFGTGAIPEHGCKNIAHGLELYHTDRFVALTGTNAVGDASTDHTASLAWLVQSYFPPSAGAITSTEWTDGPCEGWRGPVTDEDLLARAMRSTSARAAFGNAASFADLWDGSLDALARAYPDPVRAFDASSADAALAQHLAFWTGKDCARIERLMQQSGLVRPKWEREDYLPRTILNACGMQRDVLTDKLPEPVATTAEAPANDGTPVCEAPEPKRVEGSTYLNIDEQLAVLKGAVYVIDSNRALLPGGILAKPEQFRVIMGGFTWAMGDDSDNQRTTRDAWEAFTQSQAYRCPRADGTCFKPDRAPGDLIKDAGRVRVNLWWPINVPRMVGDPSRFLTHLAKLLPDARDQQILLSYMAACVQHKGTKFKWAPLLQGVEGNGKTLMSLCVAEAVGRRYTHWPRADQITEKFNAWLFDKVFIGVEDIYVPDHKEDVIEILKPMITGENLPKRAMNTDQIDSDVCANFMLNSNHKNAVKKTRNDRRFGIFYTAQQTAADIIRDGMGGDYFESLYAWFRSEGYAIVSELLHTFPIPPEFNPATKCQRAPTTSTTEQVIENSVGGVEQEIMEAIDQGLPGFAGGWVSSMALDRLMDRLNVARRIPHNKRREMLQHLGYDWHPHLSAGRVNNAVMPDNGKPRLFIKPGHPASILVGAAEIAKAYTQAQTVVTPTVTR